MRLVPELKITQAGMQLRSGQSMANGILLRDMVSSLGRPARVTAHFRGYCWYTRVLPIVRHTWRAALGIAESCPWPGSRLEAESDPAPASQLGAHRAGRIKGRLGKTIPRRRDLGLDLTQTPNRHLWVETAFIPVVFGYLISGLSLNYRFR